MSKKRADTSNELRSSEHEVEETAKDVAEARIARERKFRKVMDEINKTYANVFRRLSE